MFILRAAFWLTVIAFILPVASSIQLPSARVHDAAYSVNADGSAEQTAHVSEPEVGAGDLLTIVARSAEDLFGFCERNPDVCAKSRAVAARVVDQTLHYGGRAITWLAARVNDREAPPPAAAFEAPLMPIDEAVAMGGAVDA